MKTQLVQAGDTFEAGAAVRAGDTFSFSFVVEDGATLEFSIVLRSAKGKETRLLPASSYSEHLGEVLLPGPGTCVARWYNPAGWFWSTNATVQYELSCAPGHRSPPAAPSSGRAGRAADGRAARDASARLPDADATAARTARAKRSPRGPHEPDGAAGDEDRTYEESMSLFVDEALARAIEARQPRGSMPNSTHPPPRRP